MRLLASLLLLALLKLCLCSPVFPDIGFYQTSCNGVDETWGIQRGVQPASFMKQYSPCEDVSDLPFVNPMTTEHTMIVIRNVGNGFSQLYPQEVQLDVINNIERFANEGRVVLFTGPNCAMDELIVQLVGAQEAIDCPFQGINDLLPFSDERECEAMTTGFKDIRRADPDKDFDLQPDDYSMFNQDCIYHGPSNPLYPCLRTYGYNTWDLASLYTVRNMENDGIIAFMSSGYPELFPGNYGEYNKELTYGYAYFAYNNLIVNSLLMAQSESPTPTPSVSGTPTPSVTRTTTPSATRTPNPSNSPTPTLSQTPSTTNTRTTNPSITPTISVTPSTSVIPAVLVVNPTASTTWIIYQIGCIKWNIDPVAQPVIQDIRLLARGQTGILIASNVQSSLGELEWTVNSVTPASNFRIRLRVDNVNYFSPFFTIDPPGPANPDLC